MNTKHWRILSGLIAAVAVTAVMGCETMPERDRLVQLAENAVARGDWDAAMDPVLGSLHLKSDHKRSIELLQSITPNYYQYHMTNADRARAIPDFTQTFYHLDRIREADEKIRLLGLVDSKTGESLVAAAPDISDQYSAMQREAATQYYLDAFDQLDSQNHKQAAIFFRRADEVLPGYEDSRQQYTSARQAAMQRMLVIGSGARDAYAVVANNLMIKFNEVARHQDYGPHVEFIEIVTGHDSGARGLPDVVNGRDAAVEVARRMDAQFLLLFHVNQAAANYPAVHQERRVEERERDDGTIRATVTFYKATGEVAVDAIYELVRVSNGQVLSSNRFTQRITDEHEWARYTGNKDALSWTSGSRRLIDQPERRPAPPEQLLARANDQLLVQCREEIGKALEDL